MLRCASPVALAAAALLLCGCGLIDPDVTNFDLTLPSKVFRIEADQWKLDGARPVLDQTCPFDPPPPSPAPATCEAAAQTFCPKGECTGACIDSHCQLTLNISRWREVDLVNEKPELSTIQDQPVLDVTIDAIRYEVQENKLNVETPMLTVFVAPSTVMDPHDPQARPIGTIPPIPPLTRRPVSNVTLTAEGRAALAQRMGSYRNPFNVLVAGAIVVTRDTPIPTGQLTVNVSVAAHAGL